MDMTYLEDNAAVLDLPGLSTGGGGGIGADHQTHATGHGPAQLTHLLTGHGSGEGVHGSLGLHLCMGGGGGKRIGRG